MPSPRRVGVDSLHNLSTGIERTRILKEGSNPEPVRHERRRTLQTVAELSPLSPTSPEWTGMPPTVTNNNPDAFSSIESGSPGVVPATAQSIDQASGSQKKPRPQSLGTRQHPRANPSILIATVDTPPIRRSLTVGQESGNGQDSSAGKTNPNRLSLDFSLRHNSSRDRKVKSQSGSNLDVMGHQETSREDWRHSGPFIGRHLSMNRDIKKGNQPPSKGKQPVRDLPPQGESAELAEGFNSKHHRERILQEQSMLEAKARRNRERRTIAMDSSSTLPSLSPFPYLPKPNTVRLKGHTNQQLLLQNSRTMNSYGTPGLLHRKTSRCHVYGPEQRRSYDVNAQLLKRASTSSMAFNKGTSNSQMVLNRSSRSISNPDPKRSQLGSQNRSIPPLLGPPTSLSLSNPQSPTQYPFPSPPSQVLSADRRSRLQQLPHHPAPRNSSVHSTTSMKSSKSNGSLHSRQSRRLSGTAFSFSPSKYSRHHRGATKEYLDALAAPTVPAPPEAHVTPESVPFLAVQERKLCENFKGETLTSERAMSISRIQDSKRSLAGSRISQRSYATEQSRRYNVSVVDVVEGGGKCVEGLTPENVRLLREREKLLRWKAEREKSDFEKKERERVREMVRRANEMEEEKSKTMAKEKKKRGCCGMLGV
ncbi:uncharacterized protein BDR25DRAFT_368998 [Lindgomyces ingoldianus]|uniref:Uncharacterized protein n=1 Tax=Lindgomyces ingoldianus TaxID=673940 RepID=A0ACB6QVP9_9PLEO|nr:uncharacterized protein BDR25DRAFT_368998 [Lindgomyces ingoldianus]KAF2470590.1 hypothetical protein BDR25DRAFT_368998 [Lindgomyces ingoldianus]